MRLYSAQLSTRHCFIACTVFKYAKTGESVIEVIRRLVRWSVLPPRRTASVSAHPSSCTAINLATLILHCVYCLYMLPVESAKWFPHALLEYVQLQHGLSPRLSSVADCTRAAVSSRRAVRRATVSRAAVYDEVFW